MREFDLYSPLDVIAANLEESDTRQGLLREQERSHLSELAHEIVAAAKLPELLASLPDYRLPATGLPALDRTRKCVTLAALIRKCFSEPKELPVGFFFPESELLESTDTHQIIYQRNSYTNDAFLHFSEILPSARAAYAHSYRAACEDVYNGICEYCILPVENSNEGQLTSFYRLIERYELKTAATCEILGNGSARSTRFALLRRNQLPIMELTGAECYLAFSLPQEHAPTPADILTAGALTGLTLSRVDSLPRAGEVGASDTHYVFSVSEGDVRAFLVYLAMEAPHATLMGLYPHLTQKGAV